MSFADGMFLAQMADDKRDEERAELEAWRAYGLAEDNWHMAQHFCEGGACDACEFRRSLRLRAMALRAKALGLGGGKP